MPYFSFSLNTLTSAERFCLKTFFVTLDDCQELLKRIESLVHSNSGAAAGGDKSASDAMFNDCSKIVVYFLHCTIFSDTLLCLSPGKSLSSVYVLWEGGESDYCQIKAKASRQSKQTIHI